MKIFGRTILVLAVAVFFSAGVFARQESKIKIEFMPISHASFVITAGNTVIYVDPTGEHKSYAGFKAPDIILVTHAHFDHFDKKLIAGLKQEKTIVIGPKQVIGELSYGVTLNNGEKGTYGEAEIEAVPAYNTTAERLQAHPKGVGNGYIVTLAGLRVYISGDTEDTSEMRALKDIDYAFVCMNLPFTMSPEQAASAVLEFKPKVVFPYHYRQKGGFSDINKFRSLVSRNRNIEVRFLKWY